MSRKAKLFPLSSTDKTLRGTSIRNSWGEPPANPEGMKLVRSWLVYDSEIQHDTGRSHRSVALGFGLAVCVSAGFWAGIGFVVSRAWH